MSMTCLTGHWYMCVCMCVYVCVYMCVYMCVCVCMYMCVYICVYIYIYIYYIYIYMCVCVYVCMCIYIYMCVCVCVCVVLTIFQSLLGIFIIIYIETTIWHWSFTWAISLLSHSRYTKTDASVTLWYLPFTNRLLSIFICSYIQTNKTNHSLVLVTHFNQ